MSESLEESGAVDSLPVESEGVPDELEQPAAESAAQDQDSGLPLDQIFEILRNERRRRVLRLLKETDGSISLGDLSERIAALENDKTVNEISSSERKRVYVGLYQCHLPKMDGMDVISFNKPRGVIEAGPNLALFDEYIEDEEGQARPWHQYYAALSVVGITALGLAAVAKPMTSVPIVEFAAATVCLSFLGVSTLHVRQWRGSNDESNGSSAS